jgi:nucleoside-diphosphate-sugar epimerase
MSYWQGKTVLVTGGSGFLGSHLVQALAEEGAVVISVSRNESPLAAASDTSGEVRSFQADLLNPSEIAALCKYTVPSIDVVVHCAALDGNAEYKRKYPAEIVANNLRFATNVLEAARLSGINEVVLVSSAEIYSHDVSNPVAESDDFTKSFTYPSDGYVLSKVMIEMLGNVYAEQFGLRIYVPRPTNLYGPGDLSGKERGRVIPTMLDNILAGRAIHIWGDGQQSRSFIHVDDAARAIMQMVEKRRVGPLNIATSEMITIEGLAQLLFTLTESPQSLEFDRSKPTGHRDRVLDLRSLYNFLDFEPRPISRGLEETTAWYKELWLSR